MKRPLERASVVCCTVVSLRCAMIASRFALAIVRRRTQRLRRQKRRKNCSMNANKGQTAALEAVAAATSLPRPATRSHRPLTAKPSRRHDALGSSAEIVAREPLLLRYKRRPMSSRQRVRYSDMRETQDPVTPTHPLPPRLHFKIFTWTSVMPARSAWESSKPRQGRQPVLTSRFRPAFGKPIHPSRLSPHFRLRKHARAFSSPKPQHSSFPSISTQNNAREASFPPSSFPPTQLRETPSPAHRPALLRRAPSKNVAEHTYADSRTVLRPAAQRCHRPPRPS